MQANIFVQCHKNKQKISYKRYIYGKAGREGYMRISEGNLKKTQKIFWKFAQKYR